jgi:beta-fructofuranosidase
LDADGCFSGCATVDTDGTPIILYTGVRLRTNVDAQPLPPPECDLHLPFIEAQLYAVPRDPGEATPHHVFVYGFPFWRLIFTWYSIKHLGLSAHTQGGVGAVADEC